MSFLFAYSNDLSIDQVLISWQNFAYELSTLQYFLIFPSLGYTDAITGNDVIRTIDPKTLIFLEKPIFTHQKFLLCIIASRCMFTPSAYLAPHLTPKAENSENLQIIPEKFAEMSSDTDDDASDLKQFDYTAYRNLYTYHAHTLSKTLHRDRESQARLREFRSLASKTEIRNFENSEILVASEDVTPSEIVLELNGLVGTIQDRIERTPTLFRTDLLDTPLLILTSTGFHGPAYVIRRSSHPNCHLEHVICHLEPIAWILRARKSITRGTEITVAFDFPPERITVDRPRPEVIRRRTVDGYVNVKARERMPPSPTSSESESLDANTTTSGSSDSFTSSDSPSMSPRVPMSSSAPLKRIRTENGWKTLPAKEKILKKSTSSENPKKKKKKSGGRWGAGWTTKTKKRKVCGAKTTVSPKIPKLDSESIVTSSESKNGDSGKLTSSEAQEMDSSAILTSSDSSKVKNSGATSPEAILASSASKKVVYSILTSSESQKMNPENLNPNMTSSEAQKIDNLDFENSEFQKLTSSDSDEKIPPPNPQKSINRKKKKPRREPWSSGGGRKKKYSPALKIAESSDSDATSSEFKKMIFEDSEVVVPSSDAPDVAKEHSEPSGAPATSFRVPEVEKTIVMSSGAPATSSEALDEEETSGAPATSSGTGEFEFQCSGEPVTSSESQKFKNQDSEVATSSKVREFGIEYSGELGASVTSSKMEIEDSEAPEAYLISSDRQEMRNSDSEGCPTSSETPVVKIDDLEAPEANLTFSEFRKLQNQYSESPEDVVKIEDYSDVSMEFGEAADLLIFAENEEMSNVTSSGVPEEDSDRTSSEISESSVALLKILENHQIPTSSEDSEVPTSSEIFQNLQSTFYPEITENLDSEVPTSSEIFQNSPALKMAENLDSEPKALEDSESRNLKILENYRISTSSEIPKNSQAPKIAENAQYKVVEDCDEIFENTYSEDVIALLKTLHKKNSKTQKIRNYRAQNLRIRQFRLIQNSEDPEDVKLLALSNVNPGTILLELIGHVALLTETPEDERSGKWMYTANFLTKNAQKSAFGDHRYPKSIFCIDPINECRFLRRSCKPNAHFEPQKHGFDCEIREMRTLSSVRDTSKNGSHPTPPGSTQSVSRRRGGGQGGVAEEKSSKRRRQRRNKLRPLVII
ncbi:Protein CBG15867 [Caenorhabditis briggsae]|uniref:Protein CBG15867 n=1 Tax=Caenorhabditis briggsae TaxID=6238 RepID=A8XMV2_CAEBR|nr:Protein CBG15867 [Caenorhabditis briggsae]CAP33977.1 Protein CBG15867 [Caenorhabditis briggsae]